MKQDAVLSLDLFAEKPFIFSPFPYMVYSALASFCISTAIILFLMHRINVFHVETSMGYNYRRYEINKATWIFVINAIIHAVWIFFVW